VRAAVSRRLGAAILGGLVSLGHGRSVADARVGYFLVNAFLVVIWAVSRGDDGFFWPIFVIVGWGIGVVANAWDVYGRKPITEDEIRREQERLRG
jgi:hypothetical protein